VSDPFDLLVLGDANPDLVLTGDVEPRFGQTERLVDDARLTVGGSGAIAATGAARLGLRVAFCGVVGDDPFGDFLRDELGLTGTHWGCDTSNCGACVVLMDGQPLKSCTALTVMCDGHEIRTVESLEVNGELDPVQQGFHERHALQCGFCTPGMLMTTRALLDENPDPTDHEIRTAISGAICRCTGYKNIVSAVRWAAEHEAAARREA